MTPPVCDLSCKQVDHSATLHSPPHQDTRPCSRSKKVGEYNNFILPCLPVIMSSLVFVKLERLNKQIPRTRATVSRHSYTKQLEFMLIFKVKSQSNTGHECMSLQICQNFAQNSGHCRVQQSVTEFKIATNNATPSAIVNLHSGSILIFPLGRT